MKTSDFGGFPHTDLAMERMRADTSLTGVEYSEEKKGIATLSRLLITDEEGEKSIGKPQGTYLSLSFPRLWELGEGELSFLSELLTEQLLSLCGDPLPDRVLIAGLGNRYITADALGPEVIGRIVATRHLKEEDRALFDRFTDTELSLIAPGVLAQTGIESSEMVKAVVKTAKPKLVIAVDALAARSLDRLAATCQLASVGLRPGSGIGNRRGSIDQKALGVPVVSIGVPTVVDSSTLIYDTLERGGLEPNEGLLSILREEKGFFVSPRQSDEINEKAARLLADTINLAFNRRLFTKA